MCCGDSILQERGSLFLFIHLHKLFYALDHREGIIKTLLSNDNLKEKQLIITSHGEEFIKDLENKFTTSEISERVKRYDFLLLDEQQEIRVKSINNNRHYLKRAKEELDSMFYRDCLATCRRSFEHLIIEVWKKFELEIDHTHINGKFSEPDLSTLTNKVIKKLKSKEDAVEFREILVTLKEQNQGAQSYWHSLNGGAHETMGRDEFNRVTVREIYTLLYNLNELLHGVKTTS